MSVWVPISIVVSGFAAAFLLAPLARWIAAKWARSIDFERRLRQCRPVRVRK